MTKTTDTDDVCEKKQKPQLGWLYYIYYVTHTYSHIHHWYYKCNIIYNVFMKENVVQRDFFSIINIIVYLRKYNCCLKVPLASEDNTQS